MSFISKKINQFKPYSLKNNFDKLSSDRYDSLSSMIKKISRTGQKNVLIANDLKTELTNLINHQDELISHVRQENNLLKKKNKNLSESMLGYLDAFDSLEGCLDLIKDEKVKKTFLVIVDMYKNTNESLGIQRISVEINITAFDKTIHTAIDSETVDSVNSDKKITKIIKNGYRIGDKVIRKSAVIVGRYEKHD